MRKMKTLLLFILLPLLVISSCLEDKSPVIPATPLSPEEAQVIANCYLVQQAVEAFAAENGGVYPDNVDVDATPSGQSVIDLLPGGLELENPFTNAFTEPVNSAALMPGATGYVPDRQGGTVNDSYQITGYGAESLIITLAPW